MSTNDEKDRRASSRRAEDDDDERPVLALDDRRQGRAGPGRPPLISDVLRRLPRTKTDEGHERQVGLELEFAGLTVKEATDAISESLGGEPIPDFRFVHRVRGTKIGDLRVELDTSYLKEDAYRSALEKIGLDAVDIRKIEALVETAVQHVIPCEVVTAPIPLSRLDAVEDLREALREKKAAGTHARLTYAFGLHVNPEVASLEASYLHAVLASFLLLYEWIVDVEGVDWSRRLTPFIDPFPSAYVDRVVAPEYEPDSSTLIDDYIDENPTRNRALDMLPVFMEVDEARVRRRIDDPKVKGRPAFHYRLPDCRIDQPDWRIADALRPWVSVERLASDAALRRRLGEDYLRLRHDKTFGRRTAWVQRLQEEFGHHAQY